MTNRESYRKKAHIHSVSFVSIESHIYPLAEHKTRLLLFKIVYCTFRHVDMESIRKL